MKKADVAPPKGPSSHAVGVPASNGPYKILAAAALVLLAIAMCARPLLGEMHRVFVASLVQSPEVRWTASLSVKYLVYAITIAGLGAAAGWMALTRRPWRFCGLELGALILAVAAALSVPAASNKRLAINGVLDIILPLIIASTIYQLVIHRPLWRRVLLAGLIAAAAGNCWKATAQHFWEYEQRWEDFQRNKTEYLAQVGLSPDDPEAAALGARQREPMGYFHHANVFGSFLVLGLAVTATALVGGRWWRREPVAAQPPAAPPPGRERNRSPSRARAPAVEMALPYKLSLGAGALLLVVAGWHVLTMALADNLGAKIGIVAALASLGFAWFLRDRPGRVAVGLLVGLVLLQGTLVALAVDASGTRQALLEQGRKGKGMAYRVDYWEGALRLFAENPLTGVGPRQFANRYMSVKPIYSPTAPTHVHSWLLGMATGWGVFGVLGTIAALGLAGWRVLRTLPGPASADNESPWAGLLPAGLVVLGCWFVLLSDLPAGQGQDVVVPMLISLIVGAAVSLLPTGGRMGQVILLAAAVAFFVAETVSLGAATPAAAWPFWTVVLLALAWKGQDAPAGGAAWRAAPAIAKAGLALPVVTIVVVLALTVEPIRAAGLIHQAQRTLADGDPDGAVRLFRSAAEIDEINPLALRAAALLRYRMAQQEGSPATEWLREAAELNKQATDRNPHDYMTWRSLALSRMQLATRTSDFTMVDGAIDAMQQSLECYPNWPMGWLELARMAAVQGEGPDRPALLETALEALDKAASLDEDWAAFDNRKFGPQNHREIAQLRGQLRSRLAAVAPAADSQSPSTQLNRSSAFDNPARRGTE